LDSADIRQGKSGPDPESATPDRDCFQNLTGTSLSEVPLTSMINVSWRSAQSFQRYEPNCGKMPSHAMFKIPFKNSWIRIQTKMTSKI